MFGLGNKKENNKSEKKKETESVESAQDVQVRSMPEKFLGIKPGKNSGTKKVLKSSIQRKSGQKTSKDKFERPQESGVKRNIVIGIVVIIVLGVGMASVAFFIVRGLSEPDVAPVSNNEPVSVNTPTVNPPVQQPPIVEEPIVTEEEVDEEETQNVDNSETVVVPEDLPPVVQKSMVNLDPDEDDLSAPEETLFGTSSGIADTDSDGFSDGAEVLNLFDPRFGGGAKLADSNSVKTYISNKYSYKVLVPTSWIEEVIGTTESFVRFTSENGDGFFEISVEDNITGSLHAKEWYQNQFSVVGDINLDIVQGENISGVMSPDGLVAYFVSGNDVYTLTYNPAGSSQLQYTTIFKMMVRSFTLFDNPLGRS